MGVSALILAAATATAQPIPSASATAPISAIAPIVTLSVPGVPQSALRNVVSIDAYATPSANRSIKTVAFQISPAGADQWQTFDTQTRPVSGVDYRATLDTMGSFVPQNGLYDIRAVATDSAGEIGTDVAYGCAVANSASYIELHPVGSPVAGTITLTATPEVGVFSPDTVTFEASPSGANRWTTLATVPSQAATGQYVYSLDTRTLASGAYDIRVTGEDAAGDQFIGGELTGVVIDNSQPAVSLVSPGSTLGGVVELGANATDDVSGIASVAFQTSPAGSNTWSTAGVATSAPYSVALDTRSLQNGTYDLRAVAYDNAGGQAPSAVLPSITVTNTGATRYGDLTITDYVAPASRIALLGSVASSSEGETWAYGYTNAPPPVVGGGPLPYTASGNNQLVLLSYTNATGWQIADVLRNADGSAWQQIPGARLSVSGQMTSSGAAWVAVVQTPPSGAPRLAVFHRQPGGQFLLDSSATHILGPLVGPLGGFRLRMRLGQTASGQVYGVLLNSDQPQQRSPVPSLTGPVTIGTALSYGQLQAGSWSLENASLPSNLTVAGPFTQLQLADADATGPGTGWGVITESSSFATLPLMLARFDQTGWNYVTTGLDALDMTDEFSPSSQDGTSATGGILVTSPTLKAASGGVWIGARVQKGFGNSGSVLAYYDATSGRVTASYCGGLPRTSFGCLQPIPLSNSGAVPDATFATGDGQVADALARGVLDVYAYGTWTSVPAPGFSSLGVQGDATFASPDEGWIVGQNSLGHVTSSPVPANLSSWPEANRNPLLSVALPATAGSTTDTAGSLAVGLNGTALQYTTDAGWQVTPTPPRAAHVHLNAVAFDGPADAFAVGSQGTILHWDGTTWSEDPQSNALTTGQLNAVAFAPNGEGWAVGAFGTMLHYDGTAWTPQPIDAQDGGVNVTSVTVAGGQPYAVAGGNVLTEGGSGGWQRVDPPLLPTPAPPAGSLLRASGLPDGGLVVAGKSELLVRQSATGRFEYAAQSFQGIPVALSAFRDASGSVRAYVSVAPPVASPTGVTNNIGGYPSGDGDLLLQTANGWRDLSNSQYPAETYAATGDGVVQPDPVLAVAASADGNHAWAVGGYAGTLSAAGIGTTAVLAARSPAWLTSSIWRYDAGGSGQSTTTASAKVTLPAQANTVSFGFMSSPLCASQCAAVQSAQPAVNLRAAATQIAAFARQPGGPAFAMLGGNAGPIDATSYQNGNGAADLARLPELLSPLAGVPTFAAYGPRDAVPTSTDQALPWATAFGGAPAPFGPGATPADVTPLGSGGATGQVHKYYSFDASQNGGRLSVIVLDNSAGSLEASAPGETAWLQGQLAQSAGAGTLTVVIAARPLNQADNGAATDGDAVAAMLANAGVIGAFTASGASGPNQPDQVAEVPTDASPGQARIPEYEGATMTYQQSRNDGVLWYDVSVDTSSRALTVQAVPVISSLALEPLKGLTVTRSQTLPFQAIARRPAGTLATTPENSQFPGIDQYAEIPSSTCSSCIGPSYSFESSNPDVGHFVKASSPGSTFPALTSTDQTIASTSSGLFCSFNPGATTVTVTTGLLTASLPVTVTEGPVAAPCGIEPGGGTVVTNVLPGGTVVKRGAPQGAPSPPPPAPAGKVPVGVSKIPLPLAPTPVGPALKPQPPPPAPAPKPLGSPPPPSVLSPFIPTSVFSSTPPVVLTPIPPPVTTVPPGGATAPGQSTVKREEKARKHASQSAYVIRPSGTPAADWFYAAVGVMTILSLLLIAGGVRIGPRKRHAYAEIRAQPPERHR